MTLGLQKTEGVELSLPHVLHEEPLLCERRLESSIPQIDELIGGFRAGQVALLDSDNSYVATLLHLLSVRAVSQFDEEIVWVDGGNTVNPYAISSICKRLMVDRREALSRINISRAFTAYQLVTLIHERLEEQLELCRPAMLIVSSISEMFHDKDMRWIESHQLLRRCAERISGLTKEHETITLVSNHTDRQRWPASKLDSLLYDHSDLILQIRTRRDGLLFRVPRADREISFSPVPWNQSTLDDYRGDFDGKDGAYIPFGP